MVISRIFSLNYLYLMCPSRLPVCHHPGVPLRVELKGTVVRGKYYLAGLFVVRN